MSTARHDALIAAASAWALADERVRALLLKGSLARGTGDERSDVDLVIVTQPGRLGALWADRHAIAARLDRWLGGFDEVAWQAPNTFIGFYDGPIKVDFFFQEGEPHADPWLRDGFVALVDPDGLADALPARLADERGSPDLSDFDAHAWDWREGPLRAPRLRIRRTRTCARACGRSCARRSRARWSASALASPGVG